MEMKFESFYVFIVTLVVRGPTISSSLPQAGSYVYNLIFSCMACFILTSATETICL